MNKRDLLNHVVTGDHKNWISQNLWSDMQSNVWLDLSISNPIANKDQLKANLADSFIGVGVFGSSTDAYRKAFDTVGKANKTIGYAANEFVFVSTNGKRPNRVGLGAIIRYLDKAVEAKAAFIADNAKNRNRLYNIGERELAKYLEQRGYMSYEFSDYAIWVYEE